MGGPSAHRSAWHRQQLWAFLRAWDKIGPIARTVAGVGEEALRLWAEGGRQGPWRWAKSKPGTVSTEEWEAMVCEMRERQRQVVEAIKAERECSRQRAAELRDQERREKVEEQARRAEARLHAGICRPETGGRPGAGLVAGRVAGLGCLGGWVGGWRVGGLVHWRAGGLAGWL